VFAFPDMMDLLSHELAGLRACRLASTFGSLSSLERLFLWHDPLTSWLISRGAVLRTTHTVAPCIEQNILSVLILSNPHASKDMNLLSKQ
jgi:hypothetical protein